MIICLGHEAAANYSTVILTGPVICPMVSLPYYSMLVVVLTSRMTPAQQVGEFCAAGAGGSWPEAAHEAALARAASSRSHCAAQSLRHVDRSNADAPSSSMQQNLHAKHPVRTSIMLSAWLFIRGRFQLRSYSCADW